jgi:hypothetical protein
VATIASRLRWPGQRWDAFRGRTAIERHEFPEKLRRKVAEAYEPPLTEKQIDLVFEGLRSWFLVCLYAGGKKVGMPSKVVDDAWHQYILRTKDYPLLFALDNRLAIDEGYDWTKTHVEQLRHVRSDEIFGIVMPGCGGGDGGCGGGCGGS